MKKLTIVNKDKGCGGVISRALSFLNLLDHSGTHLSITNLAVYLVLGKLLLTPSTSLSDCGALVVTLLSYAHKRQVNDKAVLNDSKVQGS